MTFVVGMRCEDGICIASDSLETDGYTKRNVKKLFWFDHPENRWGVAWGCAGDAPIIKRFNDKAQDLLNSEGADYDHYRIEDLFEALVKKMREDYPGDRMQIVIVLWGIMPDDKRDTRLYSVFEGTHCLAVENHFACAGMDTSLARFLLDALYRDFVNVHEGEQVAVFVTSMMKQKADGVGGDTQLVGISIREDKWAISCTSNITNAENKKYNIEDVEGTLAQFFWHRTDHKFRPHPDGSDRCIMGYKSPKHYES
jgi:20S proteasome alpha/beta subunit